MRTGGLRKKKCKIAPHCYRLEGILAESSDPVSVSEIKKNNNDRYNNRKMAGQKTPVYKFI